MILTRRMILIFPRLVIGELDIAELVLAVALHLAHTIRLFTTIVAF